MFGKVVQQRLADSSLARRGIEALLRHDACQRLAVLDRQNAARAQLQTLRGLIHRARSTAFGRDHHFGRIHTAEDFRRLVPLCTPTEWRQRNVRPADLQLEQASGPGSTQDIQPVRDNGVHNLPFPVAISSALLAAQREALRTALALVVHARLRSRLCAGTLLFLDHPSEESNPTATQSYRRSRDWRIERLPALIRPYVQQWMPECGASTSALPELVDRMTRTRLTCLAGPADLLHSFFTLCQQQTGRKHLEEIWPDLTAVLYGPDAGLSGIHPLARSEVVASLSSSILFMEIYIRPEGVVAVVDPRYDRLRLLVDHGSYFEFVLLGEAKQAQPTRYGINAIEPDAAYEMVLTSPAGCWAYRPGWSVCFERRDPPLLRWLRMRSIHRPYPSQEPQQQQLNVKEPAPVVALPPLHPRNIGNAAMLPERIVHSLW